MTEPDVASSDATNIGLRIERDGDEYVLNGKKWFTSGALAERCKVFIVMGKTDPNASRHLQQSMIAVPKDTPGISFGRTPHVFGYEDRGGHPEVIYENVRVPADNLLGEEGGGFAISQARLGPGRIHHCMRAIGVAERALEFMVRRSLERTTFGTLVAQKGLDPGLDRRVAHRDRHGAASTCCGPPTSWTPSATSRRPRRSPASRWPSRTWRSRSSTGPSRSTAPPASPSTSRWPRCTPTCARCASPTARTRSTR